MSGHSKWATIKRAKGVTDAKKGALFTKLSKNISLAARKGKDPEFNASLRTAIEAAKAVSMPKDNIERAISRGAGELPGQKIEEITYEGYGPNGVAMLIRCATDNTNRTSSNLKSTLSKHGGNLGGPGSVSFLFKPAGIIRVEQNSDALQLAAMDAGAEDIIEEAGGITIFTPPELFETVKTTLGNVVAVAELTNRPLTMISLNDDAQASLGKLLEELEDNDDIMDLYHNAAL
ncbi:MAG: YebC/PmpR family DNA-binding transcriptional regulator [Patescibacteria group bacterium]|jgi:YebC/PmpR family DNA-binding regulatory protein